VPIPPETAANVLFDSDRTCCVCRTKGKPVQIHHLDGDNSNHSVENLAVLCFDCHTETQVQGGFHRKLDAEQVVLYRNDWRNIVARERTAALPRMRLEKSTSREARDIEIATRVINHFRDQHQYAFIAMEYDRLGNNQLRDKYIEKALSSENGCDEDTEIYLRGLQGKPELVSKDRAKLAIKRRTSDRQWSDLARIHKTLGSWQEAVGAYCQSIADSLNHGSLFTAAYYLQEMCEAGLQARLFELALREAEEKGELWWQVRCLQELGWEHELSALLIARRDDIERSENDLLKLELYKALGNDEMFYETYERFRLGNLSTRFKARDK